MNGMDRRLVRLEKRTSPKATREERRQKIREGLARAGITYSGFFAPHSDPTDKRLPAEKLRDLLKSVEAPT
jgi:hypothetical protein